MDEFEWKEARRQQHAAIWAEIEKRRVANADNFDKAILSFSSGGLALSLTFLKDFVPIARATYVGLLYTSWALFLGAIICTLLSYLVSQRAQLRQLEISKRYNIDLDDNAFDLPNAPETWAARISRGAALAFFLALLVTTTFVAINIERGSIMSDSNRAIAKDGMPAPILQNIQQTGFQRGAPVPILQPIAQPVQSGATSAQAPAPAQPPEKK
jgi:hypothetical protein